MTKKIFIAFFTLSFFLSKAQEQKNLYDLEALKHLGEGLTTEIKGRKLGWSIRGINSLQLNQSSFRAWIQGGMNAISLTGRLDYEAHYTKGLNAWDSRIVLGLGIQKQKGEGYRKIEDIIDLQSSYGYKFAENWYWGAILGFVSQITKGMDYKKVPPLKVSNFLSPAYLALGLGLKYMPDENLSIGIYPLTSRMTFITDKDVFNEQDKVYGISKGKSFLFELGASLVGRYRKEIMQNVILDNSLTLFYDYLRKSKGVPGFDVIGAYTGILILKINKFLSSQLTLDLAYDKNQINKIQLKQTLGLGLTYLLGE